MIGCHRLIYPNTNVSGTAVIYKSFIQSMLDKKKISEATVDKRKKRQRKNSSIEHVPCMDWRASVAESV